MVSQRVGSVIAAAAVAVVVAVAVAVAVQKRNSKSCCYLQMVINKPRLQSAACLMEKISTRSKHMDDEMN